MCIFWSGCYCSHCSFPFPTTKWSTACVPVVEEKQKRNLNDSNHVDTCFAVCYRILLSFFNTANVLIKCTFSLFQTGCFLNNLVSLTETDDWVTLLRKSRSLVLQVSLVRMGITLWQNIDWLQRYMYLLYSIQ